MAGYGFRAKNTSTGSVQVDSSDPNLAVRASGVATIDAAGSWSAATAITGLTAPIIAIRATGGFASLNSIGAKGPTVTPSGGGTPGATVQWWIFDVPLDQGAGWGMRVRDANGRITFDSRSKYARVVDVLTGTSWAPPVTSKSYPVGRVYAEAIVTAGWQGYTSDRVVGANHYWTWHRTYVTSQWAGATLSYGSRTVDGEESPPVQEPPPPPRSCGVFVSAILDVTDY